MVNNLNHVKVEIILPNYNSEAYLEETIKSVINQAFKDWRLTIVDGNSNIATQEILKKYIDYKYINIIKLKKNKKAGFCRNYAIRNSKSDYIAFIDSDDIWEEEKLSKQLDFMIKNKYYFTYTNYLTFPIDNLLTIIVLVAIEVFLVNFLKSKYFGGLISNKLFFFFPDLNGR